MRVTLAAPSTGNGYWPVSTRSFDLSLFQTLRQKARETAIAEATSGNSSTIIYCSLYAKRFAMTRQSNTDPKAAAVVAMLNTVPITADSAGAALFFAFCFFVAITNDPVGSGPRT
jgi:hypothetical protein